MAWFGDPNRANKNDGHSDIPYADLATTLFGRSQRLVPLLGAGASASAPSASPAARPPGADALQSALGLLGLQAPVAQLFLEMAVAIARRIDEQAAAPRSRVLPRVKAQPAPPSSTDLAETFVELSSFDHFSKARRRIRDLTGREDWSDSDLNDVLRALASLTGVGSPVPDLLVAASYYQYTSDRERLFANLQDIFANKEHAAITHRGVADAAAAYLSGRPAQSRPVDYLIVTTNYDSLIEHALDQHPDGPVPYYVLSVPRTGQGTNVRFSASCVERLGLNAPALRDLEQDAARTVPGQYAGPVWRTTSMAVIYKIHGDLSKPNSATDGDARSRVADNVVISDEDYVDFVSLNGKNGAVPMNIIQMLRGKGLLLLGYSFRDWNVRSLYKSMTAYSGDGPIDNGGSRTADYAVMLNVDPYESKFFEKKGINILETPLDTFWQRIQENR